jgi:hypothetical protein
LAAKRVTVLGNFSGRNAGDNAILGNLLADLSSAYPDLVFLVPTLNPAFVRRCFGHHRVRALGLMPWNGSLKIFGFPALRAMLWTDAVLITDNILFDHRFFNPAFNYLSTISLLAPLCRRRNIPIVVRRWSRARTAHSIHSPPPWIGSTRFSTRSESAPGNASWSAST